MGRPSNRAKILEAAVTVAEREGLRGVTLESVATEANLTKGGVQYHFVGKDELMAAVDADIWERAETAAHLALGKPSHQATPDERLEALIRSTADQKVRAGELQLVLDSARNDGVSDPGGAFFDHWTGTDERPLNRWQWVALLASDGLWLHDSLNDTIEGDTREAVIQAILDTARR